ncbi:T cell receptor alpha chain MC.7.G5-like [Oxyura jamaicensis]|uniref:T cell receptor alpha chain MC.7.G5-like n=1 Tax=Oxyura jamaicensis TaxID=8884 RepID=UPI0015A6606C|nr:T cell receptor alpha chain MC.7.G5-like [Oxyura jamaicensis]
MCHCVTSVSNWKVTFGSGMQLVVKPDVVPSPSVYRLTTKDDEDLEMCLITDYAPENLNVKSNSADKKTEAVVEVATSENKQEASYLTTYWATKDKMECGAEDNRTGKLEGKDPESGASTVCVTGMSPHFKTDENLNTLSLTLLGLKIILMKAVIFNVVMTIFTWKKKE